MAGSKTDALEQRILDHIFKNGATPALGALATLYVALYTVAPTDSTAGTEVTGGAYARASVAAAGWTRTGSQIANNADVTFATATANWGTVVAFGILDASTGGNFLYWGDISPTKVVNNGDTAKFSANQLTVTED